MWSSDKLIINVALTGMVPTRQDTPFVPLTPDEIAADVQRCFNAGASIFHLHARDECGEPTFQMEQYAHIIEAIRARCPGAGLILCASTSGRVHNTWEARSQVLDLVAPCKPAMASLTLGSMNFPKQASINTPEMIVRLAQRMAERGIVPELEVFDMGMIDYSRYLIDKKVLAPPFYYNLLLGSLGTLTATPLNLAVLVNALPAGATWAATGIGRYQFPINALAVTMGGHVRVGLEDALYMDAAKRDLANNLRFVERIVHLARAVGREPATPDEARQLIGLPAEEC
jgi:3-keto-5-aminohexanoate cleavage enzyme